MIPPIGAVTVAPVIPINPAPAASAAEAASAGGFGGQLASAVENLEGLQATADDLAGQAVTGQLADIHDYTIAATQATLATELAVAVRNKAVEAFNEIMRMQV